MYRAKPDDGIVWITGATSGIGRALALRLARQGYRVAATGRRLAALEALQEAGEGRIAAYAGDVTDTPRMREIVAAIEAEGPITLALLNAGLYEPSERSGFELETAWRTVEVNLGGAMRCVDAVLAPMLERRSGQIAFTASLAGYLGIPGSLAYGATKAAVINMAEAMHLTYAHAGLTIQVINPGFVATAMTARNDYAMPLMMDAAAAAERICSGLRHGGFEITFPCRLGWTVKAARLLPYRLKLPLMARATRRVRRGGD